MDNYIIFIGKDFQGVAPAEIQVIPAGRTITPKGVFVLDQESAQAVISDFEAHKNDMVIDYEHQTLSDPPVEAPAAGWVKKLINKGADGIWGVIEWTGKARQYIENKEYRYVSPVFLKRKQDNKVVRLINVALTNQPNIDGMVPLMNKSSLNCANEKTKREVSIMKNLWKLLGLAEDAKEEEAIVAVNKLLAELSAGKAEGAAIVANKAVLDVLGLKEGATESEITGTIMAMKQGSGTVSDLVAQVNTLTAKLSQKDASDAVEKAVNAGKITPAQREWAQEYATRDLAGFDVFVSKAPVVVHQGKVIEDKKSEGGAIDDSQAMIKKMCGIDDETFKKLSVKEA